MTLTKRYNPSEVEQRLNHAWQAAGVYHFSPDQNGPVYSVDTPPPTVSGNLHLGHVYSYSHPDFIARFWRMNGWQVFYPMGYDDNGFPTERLVEKRLRINARQIGRPAFIEKCLEYSQAAEQEYEQLWKRLGLSIDWRYTYRTIDNRARRISQWSFINLYRRGLAYRREAPAIWCPECQMSIAQADLNDLDQQSEFVNLAFHTLEGDIVPIATTRPELLPACVAVFIHPDHPQAKRLVGHTLRVPWFNQEVPVLADPAADPAKGTGIVMCCTFGDIADVDWYHKYRLPLIEAIDASGRMTDRAGELAGLTVLEARQRIKHLLQDNNLILDRQPILHSIRVHERCDSPVEYIQVNQWFIRLLDFKELFLSAGEQIHWHPDYMKARYRAWVENLNWDWCISRQRYYGVPFPVWYCQACSKVQLASEAQLPVDPTTQAPESPCDCGCNSFLPERDILDTWATSSMSPQIVGQWLDEQGHEAGNLYLKVFPYALRPQAHEIIRTWAFYTIAKSLFHFQALPWQEVLISGWGLAGEGMGKISKSRGGGPMAPMQMLERYSADALRYWAASASPGRDSVISEEKIQSGVRLANKLWNVARFCEPFILTSSEMIEAEGKDPQVALPIHIFLTPADRWILARLQNQIQHATDHFKAYDYASAKNETEDFFWNALADNYLEMSKQRLYAENDASRPGARYALTKVLLTILKLFAPILPYVTEEIYQGLFVARTENPNPENATDSPSLVSIHNSHWPQPDPRLVDEPAESAGRYLIDIASQVRRYKSAHNLPLGSSLTSLQLIASKPELASFIKKATPDLASICRVTRIEVVSSLSSNMICLTATSDPFAQIYQVGIQPC